MIEKEIERKVKVKTGEIKLVKQRVYFNKRHHFIKPNLWQTGLTMDKFLSMAIGGCVVALLVMSGIWLERLRCWGIW